MKKKKIIKTWKKMINSKELKTINTTTTYFKRHKTA